MTKTYKRYVLHDADGEPAMHCHQDDMENPVEADTLDGLIAVAAEWSDTGEDYFLQSLAPGGTLAGYKIVCETVTVSGLSGDDHEEFQRRLVAAEVEGLVEIPQ